MQLKIYDIAGNLVQSADQPNIISTIDQSFREAGKLFTVYIYWNGSNRQGMPVSPGFYRTVIYVDYEFNGDPAFEDSRSIVNVGITR